MKAMNGPVKIDGRTKAGRAFKARLKNPVLAEALTVAVAKQVQNGKQEYAADSMLGVPSETLKAFALDIINNGFTPRVVLDKKWGQTITTSAIAILYRRERVLREQRRPTDDGELLGYEWADRRFSKRELAKLPPALGFLVDIAGSKQHRYGDYQSVTVSCRWTNKVLGGVPMKDAQGQDFNGFERDDMDKTTIIIPANCPRAMIEKALPYIGLEQSIAYRIGFQAVRITGIETTIHTRGLVDKMTGRGIGTRRQEAMPAGTKFTLTALIPTTVLKETDFLRLMQIAGRHVRFSPASSSAFGDFELMT